MATLTFTTSFNFALTPKRINFVDTSNYAGQGIPLTDVNGSFRIVSPSGTTIYNNTDYSNSNCDIDLATSTSSQQVITFVPELGTYTIIYTVYDTNLLTYSTVTQSYDNEYVSPTVTIEQTANCIGQIWTQEDTTDYVVGGITPTKTLVNTLYYPAGSAGYGSPVVRTTAVLSTTTFYNGTQASTVTATLTYVFANGLTVNDVVTATVEKTVNCAYYCSILCCIKNYERLKESYRGNNPIMFRAADDIFQEIMSYVSLVRLAIECGNGQSTDITWYLETIKALTNCTSDCDCSGDDFSRVTGWGSVIGADGTDGADGVDGTDGADGADGVAVLYNNFAGTSHTGAFASLNSYTLAADQMSTNGDVIQVHAVIRKAGVADVGHIKMEIGGTDAMPQMGGALGYLYLDQNIVYASFDATITRLSATTVSINYRFSLQFTLPWGGLRVTEFTEPSIIVNNLTSATNLIDIIGSTDSSNTLTCSQMMVTYFKKS